MSTKSDHRQVIQDEKDAEKLYQAHLEQAKIHARNLAEDTARTEAERVAAAEAEAALVKVEEARAKAKAAAPEKAKSTFWDWLTS